MSKIFCSAALCVALGTVATAADTNKGSTPNGKPFLHINGELAEVSETVASLQEQVDAIVSRVDTLEQRQTALEAAILEAKNDIETNAELIALLESELNNVKEEIQIQGYINTGTCPEGQTVVGVDQGSVTCSNVTEASQFYVVRKLTRFPAGEEGYSVSASCNLNDMGYNGISVGGGFAIGRGGEVYISRPSLYNGGWYVTGFRNNAWQNSIQAYVVCAKDAEGLGATQIYTY